MHHSHRSPSQGLSRRPGLLVANGFDWIEPRRLDRGIDAENQTDRNGDQECQKNRANGHNGGPSSEPCDDLGHHKAKEDSQQATSKRNQRGFDDKLTDDVPPPGADGTANTNLTNALENSGQHDVHDPNPADEKGNGSDSHHDGV